ncbi:PEP/pyruvate-binding domain-containing protein [Salidesulfovibrio onnuriiensis]|uniref:PEP/pyruvate-binding domain-containing protein n=1 Tax=Salidesulfovibrio onnuriiensis TaxID=2583823 RepID=UPI0011CC4ECF|nr:PEP/pyruvate-binding domain-containing protein [Salidesulfovibrio onnuriiensis]
MSLKELLSRWTFQVFAPGTLLRKKYNAFREILEVDLRSMELLAGLEEIYTGSETADWNRVAFLCAELEREVGEIARLLTVLAPLRCMGLEEYVRKIAFYIDMGLDTPPPEIAPPYCLSREEAAGREKLAGGKAAALGILAEETDIPVPPGFCITTNAYNYYMEAGDLRVPIAGLLAQIDLCDREGLSLKCEEIRGMIRQTPVPDEILREMEAQAKKLPAGPLAVRSSAIAEDGESSFAGVYESVLNVSPENLAEAYREVLMGKYSPQAVAYRILKGMTDEETGMAVLVQPMVRVKAAGVMYTTDEDATQCVQGVASIYSVKGLGESLVSGRARPDVFCLTKEDNPHVLLRPPHFDNPRSETLLELGRIADKLEHFFKTPQDVEWGVDERDRLFILQSRPLRQNATARDISKQVPDNALPMLSGGVRISAGTAVGRIVRNAEAIAELPHGAILVTETLTPALARHLDRLDGVIARRGSRAGHFASVAREFGLPVMVLDEIEELSDGQEVTMDADTGQVYAGCVEELRRQDPRREAWRGTWAAKRLGAIMPHLSILNLTDPEGDNFQPEGCRSMHDVIRFAHEISLNEMFSLVGRSGRGLGRVKKLTSKLPFVLYVLDLGGGLFSSVRDAKSITPDDIVSKPMWALWWGLSKSGATWDEKLIHVDWEEFDRISAGIFTKDSKLLASYSIVAEDYTHLLLRFGYHFTVVDSVCGGAGPNHISFRFKGGGGDWDQRMNRLAFLRHTMESKGFSTKSRGDMLTAQFTHGTENETRQRLVFLGRLMAHSRMLDLKLPTEETAVELAERFLEQDRTAGEESP